MQGRFLKAQRELFGSDHLYGTDPFALASIAYPLRKGDFWNYRIQENPNSPEYRDYRERITALGDTLMPNGLTYTCLSAPDLLGGRYLRTDSGFVHYYDPFQARDVKVLRLQAQMAKRVAAMGVESGA